MTEISWKLYAGIFFWKLSAGKVFGNYMLEKFWILCGGKFGWMPAAF